MNLFQHIHTFVTVVEAGNFTNAADVLQISPVAVSRQIKKFETELGLKLLDRSTHHMALTDSGSAILSKCQEALHMIQDLRSFVKEEIDEPEGLLKIVSTSQFSVELISLLPGFLTRYPRIEIEFNISDVYPIPDYQQYDILYGRSSQTFKNHAANLIPVLLTESNYCLCASSSYLTKHGTPNTLDELTEHHFLNTNVTVYNRLVSILHKESLRFKKLINLDRSYIQLEAALTGLGIGGFSRRTVQSYLDEKRLIQICPSLELGSEKFYFFYTAMQYVQPKILCFKNYIKDQLEITQLPLRSS